MRWRQRLSVPQFTVITGALLIAAGTVLLASPLCSTDDVGLWQALFTVTSALTVRDSPSLMWARTSPSSGR